MGAAGAPAWLRGLDVGYGGDTGAGLVCGNGVTLWWTHRGLCWVVRTPFVPNLI